MDRLDREEYSPLFPDELKPTLPQKQKNKRQPNESLWIIIFLLLLVIIVVLIWRLVALKYQATTAAPYTIQTAIAQTQAIWTLVPTQSPYPSQTPYPTQTKAVVTRVFVWTPTVDPNNDDCKPISAMDYSDRSKMMVDLQAYVGGLPNVKSVSYVIPEKLYSNTISELFHVTFVALNDGKVYSKRYIVYAREFGWKNAVFSIAGQCWIDPP
jgi:hypothetical protein